MMKVQNVTEAQKRMRQFSSWEMENVKVFIVEVAFELDFELTG